MRLPHSRTQRNARKLDRKKVQDLHAQGLSTTEIAQHQGVAPSTVWRFLQQSKPEQHALEQFKAGRADVLARIQAKSLSAQEMIIDTLDEDLISALQPHQKSGLLMALNVQAGTLFDKERLERGKSTSNLSLFTRLVEQVDRDLFIKKPTEPV